MTTDTTQLNNGTRVFAMRKHGITHAVTYANRTQATRRVAALAADGITARVYQGPMSRVFYVAIDEHKETTP